MGIIVILARGLHQLEWQIVAQASNVLACNNWADDEDEEDDEHDKVQYGVSNDPTFAKPRLFEGIDGWSDLTAGVLLARNQSGVLEMYVPWSKPEEHDRMKLVDVGDAKYGQHQKE